MLKEGEERKGGEGGGGEAKNCQLVFLFRQQAPH